MPPFESLPHEESEELSDADVRTATESDAVTSSHEKFITKTEAYRGIATRMRAINDELADLRAFNSKESSAQQAVLNEEARELAETFKAVQNATGESTNGLVANPFYRHEFVREDETVEVSPAESREALQEKYEALKKENEDVTTRMQTLESLWSVYTEQVNTSRDRRLALQASVQNAFGYFRHHPDSTKYKSAKIEADALAKQEQVAEQARDLIREYYPQLATRKSALMEELMDVVDRLEAAPMSAAQEPSDEQKAAEISAAIQQGSSEENIVIPLRRKKKTPPPTPPVDGLREAA